jgi:hypothetical protein
VAVAFVDVKLYTTLPGASGGGAGAGDPAPLSMSGVESSVGDDAIAKLSGDDETLENVTGVPTYTVDPAL